MWLTPHSSLRRAFQHRFGVLADAAPLALLLASCIDGMGAILVLFGLTLLNNLLIEAPTQLLAIAVVALFGFSTSAVTLPSQGRSYLWSGLWRLLLKWLLIAGFLLGVLYFTRTLSFFDQRVLAWWILLTPCVLILMHLGGRVILFSDTYYQRTSRKAIVVGLNDVGLELARQIAHIRMLRLECLGFVDDRSESRLPECSKFTVLGRIADLPALVKQHQVHHVYFAVPMSSKQRLQDVLDELHDTTSSIFFVPDFSVFSAIQARFDHLTGIPLIAICDTPFVGSNALIKRASDIVLTLFIMALIWPILLATAIAIKLTSPGHVLFRQRRYGMGGESILVYKFRSMTVMEDGDEVKQATRNDQRLTPIGAFLRKTSLDELPQFLNVLQGSMSVVGPRPHANAHNEFYRTRIKGYMLRHKVKPGITGWAQVNGCRGETETIDKMERRVEFDLDYLRHWSIWLDIKIIALTALTLLKQDNAY